MNGTERIFDPARSTASLDDDHAVSRRELHSRCQFRPDRGLTKLLTDEADAVTGELPPDLGRTPQETPDLVSAPLETPEMGAGDTPVGGGG